MPYKNQIKQLEEGGYYHAYNRGYNKQQVFLDEQDYKTFLYIIKKYFDPDFRESKYMPNGEVIQVPVKKPLYDKVELHAYCLMPNHFHLLVKQITKDGMPKLLKVLGGSYSSYFNQKYNRSGSAWQGIYKAVRVHAEEQYLHLSRYIHLNPLNLGSNPQMRVRPYSRSLERYAYSSYPAFIGKIKHPVWLKPDDILHYFSSLHKDAGNSYRKFVERYIDIDEESKKKEDSKMHSLRLD